MPLAPRNTVVPVLLTAVAAFVVWLGPGAAADEPGPVDIAAAPALNWGFKQSWRSYSGFPQVEAGATLAAGSGGNLYGLEWEFESGSYDASTGTTELHYAGTAHWRKYYLPDNPGLASPPPGYTGPTDIHLLDVTLSDPVVTIGPDAATISVEATSRDLDTWELIDTGRVDVVNLDVAGVTPVVAGGITAWSGIPSAAADGAKDVFASNYQPGQVVDPVSFSYTGPGGAPDVSESWDAPGSTKLGLTRNEILTTTGPDVQYSPWWIDRGRRLVHYRTFALVDGQAFWTYRAFSLDTMTPVGQPLVLPNAERVNQLTVFDSNTGRLFYRRSGESATTRWIRFDAGEDPAQGHYVLGASPNAIPIVGIASLAWDAVGQRAFNIRRFVPAGVGSTDYDAHQWQLNLYDEQLDGTWTIETVNLPNFAPGLNRRGYPETGGTLTTPTGVAAPDRSLIVLGTQRTSSDPNVPQPATVPGALRIAVSGGSATVTPVAGSEVGNASSSWLFDLLQSGPGGQVTLFRDGATGIPNIVQNLTVPNGGGPASAAPPVDLGDLDIGPIGDAMLAVDPEDGTVWVGGYQSQRIVAVADGRIVADQFFPERHPRGGPVVVGANHAVYAQTNDGSPAGVGGSPVYGFGKFDRLGWSPGVSANPSSATVELAHGEASKQVQLSSTAVADPAADRQWQTKVAGGLRFTDLQGETGPTLTLDAARGMGGSQYRAVYSNAAGRIASEPATLTVAFAPEVSVDAADVEVAEGDAAVFQVLSQGNPEPGLTWQRRVGGFWQDVEADDDNFAIGEGTLTIPETNVDQSGARFRLKVTNGIGTAYSRAAKLTVKPGTDIPPGGLSLDGVSLDWTGSPELQRKAPNGQPNYFSAGVSDGGETSYGSASAGVRVLHRPTVGALASASWATRGAQTTGAVKQLVRLTDGHAEIDEDGSAHVTWSGSFSVNFYGGLVPFTISRPELTVGADGHGTLRADLSGYGASQADPSNRHPVTPADDVTIATFSGVEIDPGAAVEIAPAYGGVEVTAPVGFATQDRASSGWGAWPQELVDFHGATGLAPYWYSSGGAFDAYKQADPFTVDFTGAGSLPPLVPGGDPPPPAADRTSATKLTVGRGSYGRSAVATVRVSTDGGPASGVANVRVAGRSSTAALRDGTARLRLPARLRPGAHTVKASYAGTAGVAASSASATLRVAKAKPRVRFAIHRRGGGATLRVSARIPDARSLHPTGQIVVRDGGRIIEVGRLRRADRGTVPVALPRLRRGTHFLRVSLSGGRLQQGVTTGYRVLRVE
jgi:hypothetical protein